MTTDKTTEAFGSFIAISLGIAISFLTIFGIGALQAHIAGDIANLFNIHYLKELTFMQLYGLAIIFGIFSKTFPSKDAEDDYSGWMKFGMYTASLLLIWITAHLFHYFFA